MAQVSCTSSVRDDDVALGRKIRDLRQGRGLSIKELALKAELSVGAISRIERGIGSTSIRSMRNICKALNVPLGILFNADTQDGESEFLRRFHERETLNLGHGTTKQKLTARAVRNLEMLAVSVDPGGNSGPENYSHEGEEIGLVLAGTLDLYISDKRLQVREGDTFAFPSTLPHRFANSGNAVCKVLWVNSPALYPEAAGSSGGT